MNIQVDDPVTVFDEVKSTLQLQRVLDVFDDGAYIRTSTGFFKSDSEGIHWVRGHVTNRHKLGKALIAARRLLR